MIEDVVNEAGGRVIGFAARVHEALRFLQGNQPDLTLLDLNLAGQSALPVAQDLVARGLRFVIVSGYGEAARPPGFGGTVLAKPFEPETLVAAARRALGSTG